MSRGAKNSTVYILETPQNYFSEAVQRAAEKRRIDVAPQAFQYLVQLLQAHVIVENLDMKTTMAEAFLLASQAEKTLRLEKLKRLGDTSLYISGFFGDSLRRKIIDIDYYADIGGAAYAHLANESSEEEVAVVYEDFSRRFLEYVDLLTYISQNALVQSNQDLLRLYERYILTGSALAKDQLIEKGLLPNDHLKKSSNQ